MTETPTPSSSASPVEEITYIYNGEVIQTLSSTLVPSKGDRVLLDGHSTDALDDHTTHAFVVDAVWFKVYSHSHVVEVYLAARDRNK